MYYLCTRVSAKTPSRGLQKQLQDWFWGEAEAIVRFMAHAPSDSTICRRLGRLPEWLGIGLQNRGQQFESATDLQGAANYGGSFQSDS